MKREGGKGVNHGNCVQEALERGAGTGERAELSLVIQAKKQKVT